MGKKFVLTSLLLVFVPFSANANQGDIPPCDPVILRDSVIVFDGVVRTDGVVGDQSACASALATAMALGARGCYVFPISEMEMVVNDMSAASAPFQSLILNSSDPTNIKTDRFFMEDGHTPIADQVIIQMIGIVE